MSEQNPEFFHQFEDIPNPELELVTDVEGFTDGVGNGMILRVKNSEVYTGETGGTVYVTVLETLSAPMLSALRRELFKHAVKGDKLIGVLRGDIGEMNISQLTKPLSELAERIEEIVVVNESLNPEATARFLDLAEAAAGKVRGKSVGIVYADDPEQAFTHVLRKSHPGNTGEKAQPNDEPEA
jgi:hypothetical protein